MRLLVELTLIEIAQITQPDEEAGSGRKPRKLKSLFQFIVTQQRLVKAAGQVAAAVVVTGSNAHNTNHPATNTNKNTADDANATDEAKAAAKYANYSTVNRPVLKANNGVGFSWNKVREMATKKKIQIVPGMLAPNDPNSKQTVIDNVFTQEELELQWMSMCNRMPQSLSAIATRMKNMNPEIDNFPHVLVKVDNQVILEQMLTIQKSIVNTLSN